MKTYSTPMLRATALGVSLLISACGGGGGGDGGSSSGNTGSNTPGAGGNPGTGNGGNPGAGNQTTVFTPAADDLPTAFGDEYPNQTTAVILDVKYEDTKMPSAAPYISSSDGSCSPTLDLVSYPNSKVTLKSLNLTSTDTGDDCLPEIKITASSLDSNFKDTATGLQSSAGKMRVRGSSTRAAEQKSFRIKTDKKMWFGEDTLQLNKHPYDLSRVRNKLAFDLMKLIPHHQTLRTQFFGINYTDGISAANDAGPTGSLGLFTHVEKMSKSYVERRQWPLAGANLFKSANYGFNADPLFKLDASGKPGADFQSFMEVEVDSGGNYAPLLQLTADLEDENINFSSTFNTYFNKNNYLTWLATVILMGNYDTRNQNFALYQHPTNGKFYFLPWDYDAALDYSHQPRADVYADWAYGVGNWWDSALHRRFMEEPGNMALLKAAVTEIRDKYLNQANIKKLLDTYEPTVKTYIDQQPDKDNLPTDKNNPASSRDQWQAEYNRLLTSVDTNYNAFIESLDHPMPFWMSQDATAKGVEMHWSWPGPFHPQGHAITYELQVVSKSASALPAGKTPFDAPNASVKTVYSGGATSFTIPSSYAGNYWIRVLAKDQITGKQTYAFDTSYDPAATNSLGYQGQSYFGMVCMTLPTTATCPGIEN